MNSERRVGIEPGVERGPGDVFGGPAGEREVGMRMGVDWTRDIGTRLMSWEGLEGAKVKGGDILPVLLYLMGCSNRISAFLN